MGGAVDYLGAILRSCAIIARMETRRALVLVTLAVLAGSGGQGDAEGMRWESAGMRGAFSASSFNDSFLLTEMCADLDLPTHAPWRFESSSGWLLQTRLDLSAGWLSGHGEDGFIASAGPLFAIGNKKFPLFLDLGLSPTFLSRYRFNRTDFGVPIQFTSHAGLLWDVGSHVTVGYRLQHMSNAHINAANPGLDLHSFGISYRF